MKILIGIASSIGTIYIFCLLIVENFAYQTGAISADEWHYKCLVMLMYVIIAWLSFSGEKKHTSTN